MNVSIRFLALILLLAAGPAEAEPVTFDTSDLSVVTERGRFVFTVEMAVNDAQRVQGLQNRMDMAPSAGMLFDFGRVQTISMWMKNTYLPLDMIFIGAGGTVVNVAADTQPQSRAIIRSARPVLAVLEVNAGTAARLGIVPGSRVFHPLFGN
jgi:uncharacterized protein